VAANVETIATRAVVGSPVKVFPAQKRGLSDDEESANPQARKRPHTEPTELIAAVFKRKDPGPPDVGKLCDTTVVKLLVEFRTHGIDPSSTAKTRLQSMSPSEKTRCKKIWTYAKEHATPGDHRKLFVHRSMKFSSEREDEQTAYKVWKEQII
jgi:hypothetical protein